ncbi:MAG: universal stress protein [Myxococcota bacterium]
MSAIRTILVPVDFSPHAAKALDFAVGLAKELGSKLHLMHCYRISASAVSPYGMVFPEGLDRDVRDAAERTIAEWCAKVAAEDVAVDHCITPAYPSEAISDVADEIGADLIVMGTRGLTGLKHVMLGSVAERTLRIAPCPVVTVKDRDGAD